jgi:hypothetical protein
MMAVKIEYLMPHSQREWRENLGHASLDSKLIMGEHGLD